MRSRSATTPLHHGEALIVGKTVSSLPLEHTEVNAQVIGMLATVSLAQRFANPFGHPIELTYRFAIPHEASLAGLTIQLGQRSIEGEIVPRVEAEEVYRTALSTGHRAALATEERPNLYTVQVGNLQPGETMVARYRYSLPLRFDGGEFELVLPFGITPRYHPADASPEQIEATTVPIASPGSPIGPLEITVAIDAGVAIDDPVSPSHDLEVSRLDDHRCLVRLAAPTVPDQDFVLRYRVRDPNQMRGRGWRTPLDGDEIVYAVVVPPPPDAIDDEALAREFVFILDRSGSMSGLPIAQARNALRACLRTLTPRDTFRILLFDSVVEWYRPSDAEPLPFSDATLRDADAFLACVEGRGGTELLPALQEAIARPRDPKRSRVLVLLTDGATSGEAQATNLVTALPAGDRLFCFGIGPAVNRYLLDRLARVGRGVAEVVGLDEDIETAIIRFQDRLSYPVLTDLEIEVDGASVTELYPSPLPDLFAGQVLPIVARLRAVDPARLSLRLRGRRGADELAIPVAPPTLVEEPMIRRLWAQKRIDALLEEDLISQDALLEGGRAPASGPSRRETVVALSCQHHIVTPLTALLAIDRSQRVPRRTLINVAVSAPLPAGLSFRARSVSSASQWLYHHNVDGAIQLAPLAAPARRNVAPLQRRSSLTGFQPVQSPAPAETGDQHPAPRRLATRLSELIRAQGADGSWGGNTETIELTAVALVAFARAGHTPARGSFRRPLARALRWLETRAVDPADRLYLIWALAEIAAAQGQPARVVALRAEAVGLATTVGGAIAEAILRRLEQLGPGATPPNLPAIQTGDHRVAIILRHAPPGLSESSVNPIWEVCGLAAGNPSAVAG